MDKTIHTEQYKGVIERLKQARKEAGLTQIDVAKKLQKSQSYISKVEKGEQRIDVVELNNFCKLYNKSFDYFIKK